MTSRHGETSERIFGRNFGSRARSGLQKELGHFTLATTQGMGYERPSRVYLNRRVSPFIKKDLDCLKVISLSRIG